MTITDSRVHRAVAEFDRLTQLYAEFGASDTEPREVFTTMLERLHFDGNADIPVDWQLFSSMKGYKTVAIKLSAQARKVVKEAKQDPAALADLLKARYPHEYDY
jgi:hypothetical protein